MCLPLRFTAPQTTTRHYTLELKWSVGAPDGFQRAHITVNGQTPGPTIKANVGDRLIIKVVNKLPANTTIHWCVRQKPVSEQLPYCWLHVQLPECPLVARRLGSPTS